MPNVSITLPDTSQSVSRPIVFDIIDQIRDITKINKDTKIYFPGDILAMQTPGTSIDSNTERFASFNTNNIVFIEVEEDFDHDTLGSTAVAGKEHIPVFIDQDLDVRMAPVYATTNIIINFKYRCVSKTEALRWRDDIRMRVSQMRDVNLHDLTYHYSLPLELLVLLVAIHETKELVEPYDETFEEFMRRNSTTRLSLIGDLVNQDARLAISEKQCRIVGMFTWDAIPDKPEREDTGTWVASFSYKFSYEKPIACNFKYPVMIHNNLLPQQYTFGNDQSYDLYLVDKSYTLSLGALAGFESDTIMDHRVQPHFLLRLPDFDDYQLPSCPPGTGSAFIALCEVDLTDKRTLLNLNELGDVVIDHDILQFIKEVEYPFMCNLYHSIFHLSLYRNNYLTTSGTLALDAQMDVKAVANLNLRHQHRVRLSIITDLTLLTREALDRLRRYPKVLAKVIQAINELFKNHPDMVNLGNKKYITELEFSPIYALLTGYALDNGRGTSRGNFYGQGLPVNSWPRNGNSSDMRSELRPSRYRGYTSPIFKDIDPRLVERYRNNRVGSNTASIAGIIAIKQNQ